MNLSLTVFNFSWIPVFTIPKHTQLQKGRSDLYRSITGAASKIENRFLCYAWGTENEKTIFYCGSIAQDYKHGNYSSNLQGRVHNYLTNHRVQENGRNNTNLNVFRHIENQLDSVDVTLFVLYFDQVQIGEKVFSYVEYSVNPELIHAVEQVLICHYKSLGQCEWNRTGKASFPQIKNKPVPERTTQIESTADRIRQFVFQEIILPARKAGKPQITISARDIHIAMDLKDSFPNVCQVLDGNKFIEMAKVELIDRTGPLQSSTVKWILKL